jgi:Spy/CpxP family protein refolding chaperone
MKHGAWFGAVALALMALAVAPVAAARGGGKRPGHEQIARMAEALDLTAEQRTQMRGIAEKYRSGPMGDHLRDLRRARMELRKAIQDVKATDAQVQDAAREVASHAAFVAVERHRMAIEMDRVLTEEQRQKAAELRQQRRERRESRHGDPDVETDEP